MGSILIQGLFCAACFFDNIRENKTALDTLLEKWGTIVHDEQIKTYEQSNIRKVHTPWRYFFRPDRSLMPKSTTPDEDIVTHLVMKVNAEKNGALIFRREKSWGFKAAGLARRRCRFLPYPGL